MTFRQARARLWRRAGPPAATWEPLAHDCIPGKIERMFYPKSLPSSLVHVF
jgi:hypothetical protein